MVKLFGLAYILLSIFSYLPLLFIAREKFKTKIETERVLFFIPTMISILILLYTSVTFHGLGVVIPSIVLIPNFILQVILYINYIKKLKATSDITQTKK